MNLKRNIENCLGCNKKLTKTQIRKKKKYCTHLCFNKHRNCSGENNPMFNKRHSKETKKDISEKALLRPKIIRKHICKHCGIEYINRKKNSKYCTKKCNELYRKGKKTGRIKIRPECIICGKEVKWPSNKYCSNKCVGIGNIKPRKPCLVCGKLVQKLSRKFCSQVCDSTDRRRRHLNGLQKKLKKGQQLQPFFNIKACEYFGKFDKNNNTKGQYATNGGEKRVPNKHYWLDYFNSDKKLIIEWNELRHYKKDGSLKEKDIRKKAETLEIFNGYKYWIINGNTMRIIK